MMTVNQTFKYNIGQMVSGSKPMVGKIYGTITGRTILNMGSKLYWVRNGNGIEYKLLEHQIHQNYENTRLNEVAQDSRNNIPRY